MVVPESLSQVALKGVSSLPDWLFLLPLGGRLMGHSRSGAPQEENVDGVAILVELGLV
jgi:hypothetical protein